MIFFILDKVKWSFLFGKVFKLLFFFYGFKVFFIYELLMVIQLYFGLLLWVVVLRVYGFLKINFLKQDEINSCVFLEIRNVIMYVGDYIKDFIVIVYKGKWLGIFY